MDSGEPIGPHSTEDIRSLLLVGTLDKTALVWREGMPQWSHVRSRAEFADLFPAVTPPPLPPRSMPAAVPTQAPSFQPRVEPQSTPAIKEVFEEFSVEPPPAREPLFVGNSLGTPGLAGPWTRYFARTFDLSFVGTVLMTGITFVLPYLSLALSLQWYMADPRVAFLLLLPIIITINGVIISVLGNSIGKAIFGIKTMPIDGRSKFSLAEIVRREFRVWSQGLAFGIPVVNFFTMVPALKQVSKGLPTTYDLGTASVRSFSNNAIRRAAGMVLVVCMLLGIAFINAGEKIDQRALQTSTSWTNPITRQSTTIPAGWQHEVVPGPDNNTLYAWTHIQTGIVVFLAYENIPGATLANYRSAMSEVLAGPSANPWSEMATGLWKMNMTMKDDGWPATIFVTQRGDTYWRILYLDQVSKTARDLENPAVTQALLRTLQ